MIYWSQGNNQILMTNPFSSFSFNLYCPILILDKKVVLLIEKHAFLCCHNLCG